MALLKIKTVEEAPSVDGVTVAALSGEVDLDTVSHLRAQLEQYHEKGLSRLVLDMSETTYVNSSALAVLVRFAENYRERSGGIYLAAVTQRVRIPFEMLGLLPYFRFFDDVATAKAGFAAAPSSDAS